MDYRSAYGLVVSSEVPLDDLPRALVGDRSVDVQVTVGKAPSVATTRLEGGLEWHIARGVVTFRWEGAGTIVVSGGNSIIVDAPSDGDPHAMSLLVQGPGLNAIVRQRGMVMLHAAGVDVGGRCCAIVGSSGMGKSTLAAALGNLGYPLIADDGIVIHGRTVLPAFPTMKLWPQSAERLVLEGTPLLEGRAKLRVDAPAFTAAPLPLGWVVLLADGEDVGTTRVDGARAAMELIANASRAVALEELDPAGHFQACARLAAEFPIWRLTRPRDLNRLDDLANLVASLDRNAGNEL